MRHLKKIITFFIFIFITGIYISFIKINTVFKKPQPIETVKEVDTLKIVPLKITF